MIRNRFSKTMAIQGLCFALCFFAFQLTEFTVNDRADVLLGAEWVNAVYSAGIACTALGFLSFSVLRRFFCGRTKTKSGYVYRRFDFSVNIICSADHFL